MENQKVYVTERALKARINRKLEKECKKLHSYHTNMPRDLGWYYVTDEAQVVSKNIDLTEYAERILLGSQGKSLRDRALVLSDSCPPRPKPQKSLQVISVSRPCG